MNLGFDIMERVGEDVMHRRNYNLIVGSINNLFANFQQDQEDVPSFLHGECDEDDGWNPELFVAREGRYRWNEGNQQIWEEIWTQATTDTLAELDPSNAY